ncbi:hypothetical protein B4N89_46205 [Embleya scabrispora]|uniref:Uncharacterized protein n=1 Tax=Embleya scabrispora TaxID=159449 RepID=A0A1T3NJG7_9ACTN|nr:hypothetical protein [Embleya scabrispora]OPC76868.1 hypothetical protein B4N89_46205 [Embleya scabrispora]
MTHRLPLPIDVSKSMGIWTASLGVVRGVGSTQREALADLGRLVTALAEHNDDEAAFAIDDDGTLIAAVSDGLGGSTEYRVRPDRARITGGSDKPPAESLREVHHYSVIPTR